MPCSSLSEPQTVWGTSMKNVRSVLCTQYCLALAAIFVSLQSPCAVAQVARFAIDSYILEYPSSWSHKIQPAPDGSQLHMFMGPQQNDAMAYCHTTQQPILASLAPRVSKMSEKQRVEFFSMSDQHFLFSIYSNLPSAQGFRLIHAGPAVIGRVTPAFTADFMFRVPQGFIYRVRSHYTFWNTAQLSIWCQTVSRSESGADKAFQNNLGIFQKFVASVSIAPTPQ